MLRFEYKDSRTKNGGEPAVHWSGVVGLVAFLLTVGSLMPVSGWCDNPEYEFDVNWKWEPGEEVILGYCQDIVVGVEGRTYVLDSAFRQVIMLDKAGGFLGIIGGEGTGPGYFQKPVDLFIDENGLNVVDLQSREIEVFAEDGKFIKVVSLDSEGVDGGMVFLRGMKSESGLYAGTGQNILPVENGQITTTYLSFFDAQGKELNRVYSMPIHTNFMHYRFVEKELYFPPSKCWSLGENGVLYYAPLRSEYQISSSTIGGETQLLVDRPGFVRIRRAGDTVDMLTSRLERASARAKRVGRIEVDVHMKAISEIWCVGSVIWVRTPKVTNLGMPHAVVYEIYSGAGEVLGQCRLPDTNPTTSSSVFVQRNGAVVISKTLINVGEEDSETQTIESLGSTTYAEMFR